MRMGVTLVTKEDLKSASKNVIKALARAMVLHARDVLAEAQASIQRGPKTGRVYRRGKISHRASAPGEPPATDTGRLVSSGHVGLAKVKGKSVSATVEFPVEYAVFLEKGSIHMEPRPFLRPAALKLMESGRERIRQALKE
jgi:hypothetical protein